MPTTEWRLKAERDCQGGGPVQWIMFQVDGVDVDGDEGDDVDGHDVDGSPVQKITFQVGDDNDDGDDH